GEPPTKAAASAVSGEARASTGMIEDTRASLFTSYLQRVETKVGRTLCRDDRPFDGAVVVFLRRRAYRRRHYVLPGPVALAPRRSFLLVQISLDDSGRPGEERCWDR